MRTMSATLVKALARITATTSLAQLFKVYATQEELVAEHGNPGESVILWRAYYNHIGRV